LVSPITRTASGADDAGIGGRQMEFLVDDRFGLRPVMTATRDSVTSEYPRS
jgi:hypothetical protein